MMHDQVFSRRADLAADAVVLRKLWRSVLVQALRDAKGAIVSTGSVMTREDLEQRRARAWIGSRDFREVCDLAGIAISPDEARAAVDGPLGDLLIRKSRHQR